MSLNAAVIILHSASCWHRISDPKHMRELLEAGRLEALRGVPRIGFTSLP